MLGSFFICIKLKTVKFKFKHFYFWHCILFYSDYSLSNSSLSPPFTVYSLHWLLPSLPTPSHCLHPPLSTPSTVYNLHCLPLHCLPPSLSTPFTVHLHCLHPSLSNSSLLPLSILYTVYPFTVYPLHCHKCSLQMITSLNKIIETITS